jgi:ElaB/YqjD/DUF883 family membrane-anchored ribosome-binding protein
VRARHGVSKAAASSAFAILAELAYAGPRSAKRTPLAAGVPLFGDIDMPANAADYVDEKLSAATGADTKQLTAEAQRVFTEARGKIQQAVQDGLEQIRAQSRTYADSAGEQMEQAQQYVTERVRERPLAATGAALGVGVLIGLLLSSGRR